MILIFSFLMYPIFFIIAYICGEYIYPSNNGALLFAFCAAFVLSYLYYTIRQQVRQLTQKKINKKLSKEASITALMLVSEKDFKSAFRGENILADNSFTGINEEKILEFLRVSRNDIHIYSIKGVTDGAKNFLEILNINYTIHDSDEILEKTEGLLKPNVYLKKDSDKLKNFKAAITSEKFKKFSIKYGVIFLLLSIITPYKLYYILFGCALIVYAFIMNIKKYVNQRNQIPYPRS